MNIVKTTKSGLILVDYSQLTNMAIRLRKEILTNSYNKAVKAVIWRVKK